MVENNQTPKEEILSTLSQNPIPTWEYIRWVLKQLDTYRFRVIILVLILISIYIPFLIIIHLNLC